MPELDAVLGRRVLGFGVFFRRLQQRLRRDAADVEAGAAEPDVLLDAGDVHAELRGADGADVAGGAAADDDEIEVT